MKNLIVMQEESSDCGVCSLLSIIRYYKGNTNLESLRIASLTTNKGVNAYNLIQCAIKNGFNAEGMKIDNFNNIKLPCIIHLKINHSFTHFAVLYEIKKDKFIIMDPAKGFIKLSKVEFYNIFTGNIIALEPKNKLPYKKENNIVKENIFNELYINKKKLIIILFLDIIFIILNLINSQYIKIYNYSNILFILFITFIFLNTLINIFSLVIYKKQKTLSNNIEYNLTNNFMKFIFKLPLNYLHLKDRGEIVKRTEEISLINQVIINNIINNIFNILIILNILIFISLIFPKIIILIIIMSLITLLYIKITYKNISIKSRELIENETTYNNELIDKINGITSIKHTKCENNIISNLLYIFKNKLNSSYNYEKFIKTKEIVKESILTCFKLYINIVIIKSIIYSNKNFQDYIIINTLLEIYIQSFSSLLNNYIDMIYIKNMITKTNDFYNISISEKGGKKFKNGDIEINNLKFIYSNKIILNNFNLKINKGEKVILKGPSGCGKSTLCKILNKELINYEGLIKVNNLDIKKINTESYQNKVSYSSQNERIFNGTIKDNILMGRIVTDDKLSNIIKLCSIDRILSKRTLGLDTFLFGGGEELSGGERQLIILARSLISDFDILILDESLSEVNDTLEDKILENLFNKYKDKTIIYVSHKNKKEYFKRSINV